MVGNRHYYELAARNADVLVAPSKAYTVTVWYSALDLGQVDETMLALYWREGSRSKDPWLLSNVERDKGSGLSRDL